MEAAKVILCLTVDTDLPNPVGSAYEIAFNLGERLKEAIAKAQNDAGDQWTFKLEVGE